MKIAVFLPNWIGDVVMATPALRALRRLAGDGELVGVMRPYVADVLAGMHLLDDQIHYDLKSKNRADRGATAIARLRAFAPDKVVLLTGSLRTAWMAWRSGGRERIGVARDLRSWLLTHRVQHSREQHRTVPQVERFLDITRAAGCSVEPARLSLATTPADEAAADAVWRKLRLPSGDRVVIFNSGGAYGAAKHWPVTHFATLAKRLVHEHQLHVLVNCGPSERQLARDIVSLADHPHVASLADFEVPLGLTKAVIRRSRLLVTTDSGPRFFGVAFGKPVVSLFGPTPPGMTRTRDSHEWPLSLSLDCQPCVKRTCPLGHHQCMVGLTVDPVLRAVNEALRVPHLAAHAA